eukprot:CAMPEP_0173374908 /NCGR_PEP_ID=MMETSP1144-20121109/29348_1 /TAXON_ID=483371 /ORGANISM="non described non described, Strain CCMP2298" /LENGTH=133 /DNA_ID=CAMNT_0014327313 /DNA_START=508 /DNA_END=906 /DNA_ORIENTATION=-
MSIRQRSKPPLGRRLCHTTSSLAHPWCTGRADSMLRLDSTMVRRSRCSSSKVSAQSSSLTALSTAEGHCAEGGQSLIRYPSPPTPWGYWSSHHLQLRLALSRPADTRALRPWAPPAPPAAAPARSAGPALAAS